MIAAARIGWKSAYAATARRLTVDTAVWVALSRTASQLLPNEGHIMIMDVNALQRLDDEEEVVPGLAACMWSTCPHTHPNTEYFTITQS